jgi:hypothetical protein
MIRFAIAGALLVSFAGINTHQSQPQVLVASKCTGQDPCIACKNCHNCGHCKKGGTCGACKPKKKLLAYNVCE